MSAANNKSESFRLPILQGVLPIKAAQIPATGSDQYVALAAILALMAAGFLILARLVGLGFMKEKKIRLIVGQVLDDVKTENRYQLSQLFGEDAFYDTLEDVVKSYRQ